MKSLKSKGNYRALNTASYTVQSARHGKSFRPRADYPPASRFFSNGPGRDEKAEDVEPVAGAETDLGTDPQGGGLGKNRKYIPA
jgi:hypothetical protein